MSSVIPRTSLYWDSLFYGTTAVENAITERAIAVRVHPGCCTGARILLPCEISQQYHANELFTHRTSLQYFRKSKVRIRRFSVPVDNFLRTLAENIQYTYYYSFVWKQTFPQMLVRSKASLTRAGIFLKTEIFSSVFTKNTHLTRSVFE